ncbi:MAG: hypothetical protein CVU13_05020 [Bacteroidetes bacterium HGW-Bacteroidetes-8]|jgi:hypothetical protein|nr:MAG: hypothetical protein CVU13_05020 [Bacteroidetes bacterium HGW-Bacteroidetes-8]
MKTGKFLLLIITGTLLLHSCSKEINLEQLNQFNQKVLFQYEYINYAWGRQHNGWFADSTGVIYTYNLPTGWNFCNVNETLTEEQMESNISKCVNTGVYYSQNDLFSAYTLFKAAESGSVSDPVHEMCDAGARIYSCFIYNPTDKTYKKVLLKEIGDWKIENNSNAAKNIVKVMESISNELITHQKL